MKADEIYKHVKKIWPACEGVKIYHSRFLYGIENMDGRIEWVKEAPDEVESLIAELLR